MMSFLIVFNQPGPLPDFNKTSLISCIMQNTLLYLMMLVILILGLRPSAWVLAVESKGNGAYHAKSLSAPNSDSDVNFRHVYKL